MRILFTRFPLESAYGGAETQTISLMNGLQERGHRVHFLGSCPVLLMLAKQHDIEVTELDIGPPPVSKWNVLRFWWNKELVRTQLIDAYHTLGEFDAVCMLSLSEKILLTTEVVKNGTTTVWLEHDPIGRWLLRNPWRNTLAQCSQFVHTVPVSAASTPLYEQMGWDSVHITPIPNGIASDRLLQGKKTPPTVDPTPLQIGCAARFAHEKGVDVLLRAVANCSGVHLHLLGKGPEEKAYRKLVTRLGLAQRVTFHERVANIRDFYSQIHALVLPSRTHDPFGLVAAEAMLVGLPVVVTDVCGIATYIEQEKDALIIPANDVDALQEVLVRLEDADFRSILAKKGQEKAQTTFSLDAMIDQYEKLFSGK